MCCTAELSHIEIKRGACGAAGPASAPGSALAARPLRAQLSRQRGTGSPGASALTAAELRVLPLLATHLSSAEIAAELSVSFHTIKSQQASLYRKLGASSRSQAVARARELGLLEG